MKKDSNLPDKVEITDDKVSDNSVSKFYLVFLSDLFIYFFLTLL